MDRQRLRVVVAGVRGKMGETAVRAVRAAADLELVAGLDRKGFERQEMTQLEPIFTDPKRCFMETAPDVLVDLTHAAAAENTIFAAITAGVRPVIGTTGLTPSFLAELREELLKADLGGLYAPNFAIGAILMMRAAEMMAQYLPDVEIVEYHHEQKRDAPSGTARKTAEKIARVRKDRFPGRVFAAQQMDTAPTRAFMAEGVPIHSIRLSGFVAHQEVIFGGVGERISIRHDTATRESFMPGVLLGIREVMKTTGLVEGLEHFLL